LIHKSVSFCVEYSVSNEYSGFMDSMGHSDFIISAICDGKLKKKEEKLKLTLQGKDNSNFSTC